MEPPQLPAASRFAGALGGGDRLDGDLHGLLLGGALVRDVLLSGALEGFELVSSVLTCKSLWCVFLVRNYPSRK